MKDKRSIEEQVAELTEKQKDTVVKVGKWGSIILLAVVVPLLLFFLLGLFVFIMNPLAMTKGAFIAFELFGAFIAIFVIAYFIVIKTVFPYYSDKKAQFIMKSRKNNKTK